MSLKTNYKDDLLDTSKNTSRVYDVKDTSGTVLMSNVRLVDKTEYAQKGDNFGSADINAVTTELNATSDAVSNLTLNIKYIKCVKALPADASSHRDTLYLVSPDFA